MSERAWDRLANGVMAGCTSSLGFVVIYGLAAIVSRPVDPHSWAAGLIAGAVLSWVVVGIAVWRWWPNA